jgi:hypothetical protein
MTMKRVKPTGPLRRLTSDDYFVIKRVLAITARIGIPNDQTQRKAFKKMVPTIFAVRKKTGATFQEITTLFNKCGFALKQSTVRSYYAQFLPLLQKECEAMVQELTLEEEKLGAETIVSGLDNA